MVLWQIHESRSLAEFIPSEVEGLRMTRLYVAPGRIEFVGKHVDYAGGRSLTCATTMAIRVRASVVDERAIRVDSPAARPYTEAVARRVFRDFPNAKRGVSL